MPDLIWMTEGAAADEIRVLVFLCYVSSTQNSAEYLHPEKPARHRQAPTALSILNPRKHQSIKATHAQLFENALR
jgi:hypothetical protein